MQFNIIFKTIFEYIYKECRFVHTNTFCNYRKNYAHRLACILLVYLNILTQSIAIVCSTLSKNAITFNKKRDRKKKIYLVGMKFCCASNAAIKKCQNRKKKKSTFFPKY